MLNSKKAQVGESVTWIIATLIIVMILLIFIYASVILGKTKTIKRDIKIDSGNLSLDWIKIKTEIAYKFNIQNKNKISSWIAQEDE